MQAGLSIHIRAAGRRGNIVFAVLLVLFACLSLYSVSAQKAAVSRMASSPAPPSASSSPASLSSASQTEPNAPSPGEVTIVEGYRLQPPASYAPVPQETPDDLDGVSIYAWGGPVRRNGTRPLLLVSLIVSGDKAVIGTPEQAVPEALKAVRKRFRDWTQTSPQSVTIHDLTFLRVGWSGTEKKRKIQGQGWLYVGLDGDTLIQILAEDATPYAAQTLPQMQAAVQTWTRPSPRIYYSAQWPDHAQIFAMNPDGSGRVCLTPASDSDYHPALSPDGATIAFSTHRDGVRALYLMNADGTHPRRLTIDGDAGLCAWSPDGARLAFSSNREGRYCIYTINADGSQLRRVTNGPSDDCPSWSSDGKRLAYEGRSNEGKPEGNWRIWIVNADGTGAKPITAGRWNDRWPQWSPDEDALAYTSYEHGNADIYLMRSDGTANLRLTTNPSEDRQPSWSADGRQLLFHSSRAGRFDIYTFDLATLAERRLSVEPKDTAEAATWGRRYVGAAAP